MSRDVNKKLPDVKTTPLTMTHLLNPLTLREELASGRDGDIEFEVCLSGGVILVQLKQPSVSNDWHSFSLSLRSIADAGLAAYREWCDSSPAQRKEGDGV